MSRWEVFDFGGRSAIPKMSIRRGGQIGLNAMAVQKFKLEKYKYVILMINKSEKKIGIKFTNDENEKGAKKFSIIQGGGTIPAKKFIEYYELNKVKERILKCEWDKENGMIIAEYDV